MKWKVPAAVLTGSKLHHSDIPAKATQEMQPSLETEKGFQNERKTCGIDSFVSAQSVSLLNLSSAIYTAQEPPLFFLFQIPRDFREKFLHYVLSRLIGKEVIISQDEKQVGQ